MVEIRRSVCEDAEQERDRDRILSSMITIRKKRLEVFRENCLGY